ncbi:hypothetical protein MLD38_034107 [Melastoma candidum]|uniref:Uncharacterized protein n=1 Tax=Melastoma candidum TaxID=119954 RepID=A0ACB9M909_9MYRT|nr:hypothetical protein MLD38_034107 [Melastoma candidum]
MAATETISGPRYAPEDPTLPKPWKGLVDGKTGYLYFWNPETNATQYERPTGSTTIPIGSTVHAQMSLNTWALGDSSDDRYNKTSKSDDGYRGSEGSRDLMFNSQNAPRTSAKEPVNSMSADAYRRRHEITVSGGDVPAPFTSFEVAGFPSEILREVHNAGFPSPTPIQAQSWPITLQGRDIVAVAKTGSGKTLGYLIPGFIHLKNSRNDPRMGPTVLVLAPTRELATQIRDEAVKFGRSSRISCTCLYGGAPKGPQLRDLDRGVDVVVATPGRLNDILEMRRINLHQVSYLVLDEADRMLDMGFEPQIRKIVREVPARRQTLMFTATWPKEVRKIAADLLVKPIQVNIGNVDELVANKSITQHVECLAPMEKHRRLEQILRSQEPGSKILIFCSTKKMCDQLARNLSRPFGAAAIHGDKSQSERNQVLSHFRTGRSPILVATDVAARGLDIKDIRVVINYDFPTGVEDYVHRIGRTGRAGASGVSYTFFGEQDAKYASELIKILEGANQRVPTEIRDMASRGGMMNRFRRWGSGQGHGRGDSVYGGRDFVRAGFGDKGRGRGYSYDSRDSSGRGYQNGYEKGRSSSPNKSSWTDRDRDYRSRSRSRSPGRFDQGPRRSPVRSFHQAMTERNRSQHHGSYRDN